MSTNLTNVIKLVSLVAVLALFLNLSFAFADDKKINVESFGQMLLLLSGKSDAEDDGAENSENAQEETTEQEESEEIVEQKNDTASETDEHENANNNEGRRGRFSRVDREKFRAFIQLVVPPNSSAPRVLQVQEQDEESGQDTESVEEAEESVDVGDEQDVEEEVVSLEEDSNESVTEDETTTVGTEEIEIPEEDISEASTTDELVSSDDSLGLTIFNLIPIPVRVTPEDVQDFIEKRKEDKARVREKGYKIFKKKEKRGKQRRTTGEELQEVQKAIKRIEREKKVVQRSIQDTFDKEVEKIFNDVSTQLALPDDETETEVKDFDKERRTQTLATLKKRIREREGSFKQELEDDIDDTLSVDSLDVDTADAVGKVLKSSLEEIALLVEEESGVSVDLSADSRITRTTVAKTTARLTRQKENLDSRGGLALYQDTDEDGISDYDEEFIYFTDPRNAFTAGSLLTDGERVLLGFDVTSTSTERVAVESPRTAGETAPNLFRVNSIVVEKRVREVIQEKSSDIDVSGEPQFEEVQTIVFSGSALPNSFITLYIFSNPVIVTVKTDTNGDWEYTLDEELENGDHEIYVASVSNAGKIIAKSNLIPFVKTAEAVDFAPLAPEVFENDTIVNLKEYSLWGAGILTAILIFVALATTGVWRNRRPDEFA